MRSAAGVEVDVIWTRGDLAVGFEIKSSKIWRRKFGKGLKALLDQGLINKGYVIYGGDKALRAGEIDVFPIEKFLNMLEEGCILAEN